MQPYVYNHFKNFVGIYEVKMLHEEFEFHENISGWHFTSINRNIFCIKEIKNSIFYDN